MPDIERTTYIENRLESYRRFFDDKWKWDFMLVVRDTKIQGTGFDLVRNWEAASNSRSLPWLMIKCLEANGRKTIDDFEPLDNRKIRILKDKLVARMEAKGETMRPAFRRKLQEAIEEIDEEASEILRSVKQRTIDANEGLWDFLAGVELFHASLWSSERNCYGSLYYSYEWFLRECVRTKLGQPRYQMRRADDFKDQFQSCFGPSLARSCWTDQRINIARLARHALVHNGGRITETLEKQPHCFRVESDELQIAATHTTQLYELLKDKALELANAVSKMIEFK